MNWCAGGQVRRGGRYAMTKQTCPEAYDTLQYPPTQPLVVRFGAYVRNNRAA